MPKEKGEYTKRRNRSENFTEEEVEVMIKEVVAKKDIIESPVTASLTHKMKQTAWEEIAKAAGDVSGITRSVKEMRVKLTNLKSKVKREYLERRRLMQQKGGDFTPPELPLWETLLLDFIGEDALNSIEGIHNLLTSQWLDMEEEEGPAGAADTNDPGSTSLTPAPWTSNNAQRGSNNRASSHKRTYQEMHEYDNVSPEWFEEEKFHVENQRGEESESLPWYEPVKRHVEKEMACPQVQAEEGQFVDTTNHTPRQTGNGHAMERGRLMEDAEAKLDMEKRKLGEERERLAMDREKLKLDEEKIAVERAKIEVEREKLEMEKEWVRVKKEKLRLVETHQTKMENIAVERLSLERQRTEMFKDYIDSLDSDGPNIQLVSIV